MKNKIFNENCLVGMKRIPTSSVDLVVCDLPYGCTDCHWDKQIDLKEFWKEINRVSKHNAAVCLFAAGKFLIQLAQSNLRNYRYKWAWVKNAPRNFLNSHKMPMTLHEDILVFYRRLPTYNPQFGEGKPYVKYTCNRKSPLYARSGDIISKKTINKGTRYPVDVIKIKARNGEGLSVSKPTELLRYLIKTYSNEGETVLDPTIGSGSTAVACIETGRDFIGFEIDPEIYELACKRISEVREILVTKNIVA